MGDARWERLQAIFAEALTRTGDARERYLAEACGGDAVLRREIDALLHADGESTGALRGVASVRDLLDADRQLEGESIHIWRLVRHLGTGGMGSVYLAERTDGVFEQTVALKIVRKGMDSGNVLQRFEQERRILARLHHPNIAGLLDGGATADGRPYFVMEYVDGVPITEYCDRNRLDIRERLALFETVCKAVHYAHQSLVVHRDLKPSNILVTATGELKLLDFGIAKVLDDTEEQQATQTVLHMLTPAYASPEQLVNGPVTTQTDVYALGVVLYELLSGRRPYEVRRTPEEFRRLILESDPVRPSTAITRVPADGYGGEDTRTVDELSGYRRVGVERLRRVLQGDLDTICLAALRREPKERYSSADQMAADIRRHLQGLPVTARGDTVAYRIGKFVRRHRAAVTASAAAAAGFAVLIAFYTARLAAERDFALLEQEKTAQVVDFVTGLFEVSDPSEARGEDISARDLLDAGALRIEHELADRPAIQATMMRVLGEVYYNLGAAARAEELLGASLEKLRALHGERNTDVATAEIVLGFIYQDRGDYPEADALFTEARATRQALLGYAHQDVMEAISVQAFLEEMRGDYPEAEALHREALALARRLYRGDHANVAVAMTKLAGLFRILDRLDEAEPLLREALAMQERVYDGPHPETAGTKRQLAGLLRDTRRFEESERLYKEVIELRVRMLGPDHVEVAHTWNSYSQMLQEKGDLDAAVAANRNFLAIMERAHDGPHPSLGAAYNNLALLLRDQGDLDGALRYLQMSVDMQDAVGLPPRHPNRSFPLANMGFIFLQQERYTEAVPLFRDMLALRRENFPEEHRLVTELKSSLGAALTGTGEFAEAESLLLEAHAQYLADGDAEAPATQTAAKRLAELYEAKGDTAKAAQYRPAGG